MASKKESAQSFKSVVKDPITHEVIGKIVEKNGETSFYPV